MPPRFSQIFNVERMVKIVSVPNGLRAKICQKIALDLWPYMSSS